MFTLRTLASIFILLLIVQCTPVDDGGCYSNEECPLNFICEMSTGNCVAGCESDIDCSNDSFCDLDGLCTLYCVSDANCAVGFYCADDGFCYEEPGCTSDLECPAGFLCGSDGDCYEDPGCVSDLDCPDGFLCGQDGDCYEDPSCGSDLDCPAGYFCDLDGACYELCTDDLDCPADTFCAEDGLCEDLCVDDLDCPSGTHCETDGFCYDDCISDLDCTESEYCAADGRCEGIPFWGECLNFLDAVCENETVCDPDGAAPINVCVADAVDQGFCDNVVFFDDINWPYCEDELANECYFEADGFTPALGPECEGIIDAQ